MDVLKKILGKKGRSAIYSVVAAIILALSTFGVISAENAESLNTSIASYFTALAPLLALLNLSDDAPKESDVVLTDVVSADENTEVAPE